MVCELEGPMPTLKISKTLKLMTQPGTVPAALRVLGKGASGSLQRATAADMLCGDLRRLKSDRRHAPGGRRCWVGGRRRWRFRALRYNRPL